MKIDEEGYITRRTGGASCGKRCKEIYRNWFFIKETNTKQTETQKIILALGNVYLPKNLLGKKIRFKIEIINENKE